MNRACMHYLLDLKRLRRRSRASNAPRVFTIALDVGVRNQQLDGLGHRLTMLGVRLQAISDKQ